MASAASASATAVSPAATNSATAGGMAIGIANLPNQTHKIVSRKGATFTILLVGESGSGKTTFINTLLSCTIKSYRDQFRRHELVARKTVSIDVVRAEFVEKGFTTQINVIDSPGFGDFVNNSNCIEPIVEFLDSQHELYLRQEIQPYRDSIMDGRVHACIYFISPTGHTLTSLDVECMKALCTRVNLIPVIAKADTLTLREINQFKRNIREAIGHHGIQVYQCPSDVEHGEGRNTSTGSITSVNSTPAGVSGGVGSGGNSGGSLSESMPFAIIGSEDEVVTADGRKVRGRMYHWGVAEVENEHHCDFKKLRALLFRSHMLDLITTTEEIHYESFRALHRDQSGRINSVLGKKNSRFKEEEDQLRRRFTEQVKAKEAVFRQWEQRLIAERDKLNKDLEQEHGHITSLTTEIKAIEERLNMKK